MNSQSPLSPLHLMPDPSTKAFHDAEIVCEGSEKHGSATHSSVALVENEESEHVTCNSVNACATASLCTLLPPTRTVNIADEKDEDTCAAEPSLSTTYTTTTTTTNTTVATSFSVMHSPQPCYSHNLGDFGVSTLPPRRESVRQRLQRRRNSMHADAFSHTESTRQRLLRPVKSMSPSRSCSGVMDAPFSVSTAMSSEWSLVTSLDELTLPTTPSPHAAIAGHSLSTNTTLTDQIGPTAAAAGSTIQSTPSPTSAVPTTTYAKPVIMTTSITPSLQNYTLPPMRSTVTSPSRSYIRTIQASEDSNHTHLNQTSNSNNLHHAAINHNASNNCNNSNSNNNIPSPAYQPASSLASSVSSTLSSSMGVFRVTSRASTFTMTDCTNSLALSAPISTNDELSACCSATTPARQPPQQSQSHSHSRLRRAVSSAQAMTSDCLPASSNSMSAAVCALCGRPAENVSAGDVFGLSLPAVAPASASAWTSWYTRNCPTGQTLRLLSSSLPVPDSEHGQQQQQQQELHQHDSPIRHEECRCTCQPAPLVHWPSSAPTLSLPRRDCRCMRSTHNENNSDSYNYRVDDGKSNHAADANKSAGPDRLCSRSAMEPSYQTDSCEPHVCHHSDVKEEDTVHPLSSRGAGREWTAGGFLWSVTASLRGAVGSGRRNRANRSVSDTASEGRRKAPDATISAMGGHHGDNDGILLVQTDENCSCPPVANMNRKNNSESNSSSGDAVACTALHGSSSSCSSAVHHPDSSTSSKNNNNSNNHSNASVSVEDRAQSDHTYDHSSETDRADNNRSHDQAGCDAKEMTHQVDARTMSPLPPYNLYGACGGAAVQMVDKEDGTGMAALSSYVRWVWRAVCEDVTNHWYLQLRIVLGDRTARYNVSKERRHGAHVRCARRGRGRAALAKSVHAPRKRRRHVVCEEEDAEEANHLPWHWSVSSDIFATALHSVMIFLL